MKKILATALLALALAFSFGEMARATDLSVDGNLNFNCGLATAVSNAATLNSKCGIVTSEALTTASGSTYTLTLTNSVAAATDIVQFSVDNGTNTVPDVTPGRVTSNGGSVVFIVKNATTAQSLGGAAAFNGTIKIKYLVIKP